MSRCRSLAVVALVLLGLLLPAPASAQAPAPLTATIVFDTPPPGLTFNPTTPIGINLILANSSGQPIITIPGFSSSEFWRNLSFQLEGVGTITDATASLVHAFIPFGTCHYRGSVLLPGAGIQVTPVEVLAGPPDPPFAVQFAFGDARTHFDLSRPGRYTASARITFYAYSAGAIINDCNIEFGTQSLLSIGDGSTLGRQEFTIVSNSLEFVVLPADTTPPTTTVVQTPAPNGAGWNNQNVTLNFTATDSGGSGVNRIEVALTGAQTGGQTIAGASGAVSITAQGVTTVTYNAVDNVNNAEGAQSLTVRIDKTPPVVTPPASITVTATETGGARGSASPALAAFLAGGSATDNLGAVPTRLSPQVAGVNVGNSTLFPIGTTAVTFRFQDQAGNTGSATANVTVQPADTTATTTTVLQSPAPNAAGWNNQNVTLTFTATDNPGGSGVNRIVVTLTGAQTGAQTIPGASGTVTITTQGVTTVTYNAVDNANNVESTHSLTVRIDKTSPVVTPPASITVTATETGGARGSASPALAAFLAAGSAIDALDPAPVRLPPQVAGVSVDNNTLFSLGTNTVTFRFQDRAGNIGSASATVTVAAATAGKPAITGTVVRSDFVNILVRSVDLKFTNTGTAIARKVVVQQFSFKTLAGLGIVFYDPLRGPQLPIALGDLAPGASKTVRVFLIAPVTIRTFSMTESGQLTNAAGATSSFSTTQTLSRPRDDHDFREDR